MEGFVATVCVRVKVPFRSNAAGPHRMKDADVDRDELDALRGDEPSSSEALEALRSERRQQVEDNRISVSTQAETEVAEQVKKAVSHLGEIVGVVVEQVEEHE